MEIRKLSPEEISTAGKLFPELSGSEDTAAYIGVFDPVLSGVLAYDENMHIVFLKTKTGDPRAAKGLIGHLKETALAEGFDRISGEVAAETLDLYREAGFTVFSALKKKDVTAVRAECLLADAVLGRTVHVYIEHHTGDLHEAFADEQYGCACGYVEEELQHGIFRNAYFCGEDPLKERAAGTVVGIVYRNTGTSWWIVCPDREFSREDIISQIAFQEQYFETRIVWLQ